MRSSVPLLVACWLVAWSSAAPHSLAQPSPAAPVVTPPGAPTAEPSSEPGLVLPEPGVAAPVSGPDEGAEARPAASGELGPGAVVETEAQTATGSVEQTELRARIAVVERAEPLDASVQRPLEFAKAALERSRASRQVGDPASESRTLKLSRAAVELAEARLRLLGERALFSAAQARRNVATAELATAERALEHDRARARELERASSFP